MNEGGNQIYETKLHANPVTENDGLYFIDVSLRPV